MVVLMNPTFFGNPLDFSLGPPAAQSCILVYHLLPGLAQCFVWTLMVSDWEHFFSDICGFKWNVLTTAKRIATMFGKDICDPLWMTVMT